MAEDAAALIKRTVQLSDYIGQRTKVRRRGGGSQFMAFCPFHDNKNSEAMSIDDAKGFWKCFVCEIGGTIFDFWLVDHGMDPKDRTLFGEAVEGLAKEHHITLPERPQSGSGKFEVSRTRIKRALDAVSEAATDYLFDGKGAEVDAAYSYLVDERKMSEKLIERYGIGFLPSGHDEVVEFIKKASQDTPAAIAGGLLGKSTDGRDRLYSNFRGRIIVPILDRSGVTVGFGGREVPGVDHGAQAKWINPTETPVYDKSRTLYGIDQVGKNDSVVVVEGYFDAIAVTENRDIDAVGVAACGTSFTIGHVESVQNAPGITFAFDGDEAGYKALARSHWVANKRRDANHVILAGENGDKVDPWQLQFGLGGDEPITADPQALADAVNGAQPLLFGSTRAARETKETDAKFDEWVANAIQSLHDTFSRDELIEAAARERSMPRNSYNRVLSTVKVGERGGVTTETPAESDTLSDPNTGPMITRILQMSESEQSSVFASITQWDETVQSVFGEWFPGAGSRDTAVFNRLISGGLDLPSDEQRRADRIIASLMPDESGVTQDISRSLGGIITLMTQGGRGVVAHSETPPMLRRQVLALRRLDAMAREPEYQLFVLSTLIDIALDIRMFERRLERASENA